jgi:hypothetical protein
MTGALLGWLLLGLATGPVPAAEGAQIDLEPEGAVLVVRGIFAASEPPGAELSYQLDVTKSGASGRSTSRQSGTFRPTPSGADTLSTVRLGVQPGDEVEAVLTVSSGSGLVSEARRRHRVP